MVRSPSIPQAVWHGLRELVAEDCVLMGITATRQRRIRADNRGDG